MLPDLISRKLTKGEQDYYASPYPTYDSREPLLAWPLDVPFKGQPEESAIKVASYSNTCYFDVTQQQTTFALKIVWLDGSNRNVNIYDANSVPSTISIRRIT